jgi:hypothetical protein
MSIASYLSQLLNSSGLVPGTKIASGAIGLSQLTATGTPSGSNFLRGDNTWAAAGTGTVTSVATGTGLTGGPITTSGTISLVTTYGAVGTYTFAYPFGGATYTGGQTAAGSGLRIAQFAIATSCSGYVTMTPGASLSGTWQCMSGSLNNGSAASPGIWIRTA